MEEASQDGGWRKKVQVQSRCLIKAEGPQGILGDVK